MFDKEEYREVFSKVTASGETYRRVLNMKNNEKSGSGRRALTKIVLVAAVVALLAVTASASESVASWFRGYFMKHSGEGLTAQQGMYIEENEQKVGQSITIDGYTIEIKSAITDGRIGYLVLGFSAPEDLPLKKAVIDGQEMQLVEFLFDRLSVTDSAGIRSIKNTGHTIYYNYDDANAQDVLFRFELDNEAENGVIDSEIEWNIIIEGIKGEYYNRIYADELDATKYAGQKIYRYTDAERKKAFPEITLSEGVWEFAFRYEKCKHQEIEMITDPVITSVCVFSGADGTEKHENVTITSFILGSLSATITYDCESGVPNFTNYYDERVYVVMKDGSQVELIESTGNGDSRELVTGGPIILENVDHILLADGTKIHMPELPE